MVRYSIVTPTIGRESLLRTCESIDQQTNPDWEHVILVDIPLVINRVQRNIIEAVPKDHRRRFIRCGRRHNDFGNTCRHNAHSQLRGEYVVYVDDDDYLARPESLAALDGVTRPWAIFPTLRVGVVWHHDPPGMNRTGTSMFCHRRDAGQYVIPTKEDIKKFPQFLNEGNYMYGADGLLVEHLKANYPYDVIDPGWPLTVAPQRGCGR